MLGRFASILLRVAFCTAITVISAVAVPAIAATEEATRIGGVDVVVWQPTADNHPHKLAVAIFSHALY
jgi:hypothetical protein